MEASQLPKGPVVSRSALGPEVVGFFHPETSSVSYVAIDPATHRAAVIDAVLDYDANAGRTGTTFPDYLL